MKIVIFTSNALRHKYVANMLTGYADEVLVVSECKPHDGEPKESSTPLENEHFALRLKTEEEFFGGHTAFESPTIPIIHKEVNLPFVYDTIKNYKPDAGFVFGSWIIKEPLLSLLPSGRFVNLHLGMSPYYRGPATIFWPLVNGEPQYVGATLLHIASGIDRGDIIAHIRPSISTEDNAHTLGCKTIVESARVLGSVIGYLKQGKELKRVKQWEEKNEKLYRIKDFNEDALRQYYKNMEEGMIEDYVRTSHKEIKLVSL